MSKQAKFIVLEGPDGSGTTRHTEMLAQKLKDKGVDVIATAEPTNGPIGTYVRSLLREGTISSPEAVQLLFTADRAQHLQSQILPALKEGKTVVTDRYALSTILYGKALGLDQKWLEGLQEPFLKPDLTIITLPPFETCLERIAHRREKDVFEQDTFQKKVYEEYKNLPKEYYQVDTSGPKEKVAEYIWEQMKKWGHI